MRFSLLALVLLAGCAPKSEDTPTPVVAVSVAHPRRGSISDHIDADAVLSPLAQAALSPRISAPVRKFYVQRGSHVRAGQLLATLENRDLRAATVDAQGAYTAAEASLAATRGAQVPAETQKARLDFAQARAARDLAQSIADARQKLFDQGAIPGRDFDTAKASLGQAQAAYDIAAEHLRTLESVGSKATLQQASGTAESARGKFLNAEAQASYAELRSPIAGIVTDRPLFAGETAAAGAPLVTVMDTTALLAKTHLAQRAAQQVHVGDRAEVTLPGVDKPVEGRVSLVSPALDPGSTTLEVWVRLDNRDGRFKAGTPAHASIAGLAIPDALLVPSGALLSAEGGSKYVMLVDPDGTAHKRPVKTGLADDENTQITDGLTPQDTVITTGAYGLDDGAKVRVGAPETKSE